MHRGAAERRHVQAFTASRGAARLSGMGVAVLDREMYSEAEAARLLRLSQSTLHSWLEGGTRRGKSYRPVIRAEARGARSVTWAEFIEAGLLRQYRRTQNVPMAELRAFIDLLREATGIPYPLAHHKPFVKDRQLILEAQEASELSVDFCLVAVVRGQLMLTPASDDFVNRVDWYDDIAVGWRPDDDEKSPVRIASDQRFGKPAIAGVSTAVIWEHSEGGDYLEDTAAAFDLTLAQVRWAVAFEHQLAA